MPALHSIAAYTPDPDCPRCDGDGLVCEEHPEVSWTLRHDRVCGAPGMPCDCNRWPCGDVGRQCHCTETRDEALTRIERGEIRPDDLDRWRVFVERQQATR